MKKFLLALLCIATISFNLISNVSASETTYRNDFEQYSGGFEGSFVMYDETLDKYIIFNKEKSEERLSPCSTFKIYNSLIGLETGVLDIEDVYTLVKWNGTQYTFPTWNHDQTLASATKDSVIWYFQDLAVKIGSKKMQEYIDKIKYGNMDISGGISTFWLRSSLKISAQEQVNLLYKLYSGQLPVSKENINVVKRNITLSDENGIRLMGKTGSGYENGKWILGWFVGCVEKQGNRYFFATNIKAEDGATGGKAREISKNILRNLGVL